MKPQDSLRQSADVFEERGRVYGDAYKNFGHVLMALRPNGFAIRTVEDANRLGVFVQILSKIVRYANQFEAGGHDDSLLDLSTYAAMLRELDAEGRTRFKAPFPFELNGSFASFEPKPASEFPRDSDAPFSSCSGNSPADAIFSDPARKATLDGFKVGPIEPEAEPVVPQREPSYFRADAERRWAAENGDPLVIPEKPYRPAGPRVEEGPFDGVEQ